MTRMKGVFSRCLAAVAATLVLGQGVARAEIVEEIVAKVNDDIVTKGDLDAEELAVLQDLYRRFSGTELDGQVARAKKGLLRQLIDRRVLVQRAGRLFDMTKMQEFYLESFMEQQNIKSQKELEKLLAQEGMTIGDWKSRLVELFGPQQLIRAEVADRISVSDKDARAYYDANTAEFEIPAQATVREIVLKAVESDRERKRADAEAVRARVAAVGADFAVIAAEVSDAGTKAAGGLLGTVKKEDLAAPLANAAFLVPVGEVSAVIDADYGFHILKIDARTDEARRSFEDVKGEIESKIQNDRLGVQVKDYLKKAWSEATIWVSPKYQARLDPGEGAN